MLDDKTKQALLEVFRTELDECLSVLTENLLKIENATDKQVLTLCQTLFRTAHNIKGAAKSVALDEISKIAHGMEDQFSEWRDKKYKPKKNEIDQCFHLIDEIKASFQESLVGGNASTEVLKIPIDKIERANIQADEFVTYLQRLESLIDNFAQVAHQTSDSDHVVQLTDYYLYQKSLEDAKQFTSEFARSLQSLQDELRNMRLIPLDTILKPMERSVRDLSSSMNKSVVLKIEGGDAEIDKAILELIKDPLQHLLRNAIDHGIETVEERVKAGKSEQALIQISARHEAGKIRITFKDDGRGINLETIKKKALEKGLIGLDKVNKLSKSEVLSLIFTPGFSTSEKLSEISGRGVGLDVVMSNVLRAKGEVEIDSQDGKGTVFDMFLPLTLATTRGLFIDVSGCHLMLPILNLKGLHSINSEDIKLLAKENIVVIKNQSIPVYPLNDLLYLDSDSSQNTVYQGIELGDEQASIMLLVDKIVNEHECVIKPMPKPFDKIDLYTGVTLTGSGDLVPVLNPKKIKELSKIYNPLKSGKVSKKQSGKKNYKVLVVDDSVTTRGLTANALRSEGYEVDTMSDGQYAWEAMQSKKFDCIITDINMPRLNGFELTKLIKEKPQFSKIPIVIVTSRESDEDKKRGLDLGADVYLVKSQFSTRSLIDTLRSLL